MDCYKWLFSDPFRYMTKHSTIWYKQTYYTFLFGESLMIYNNVTISNQLQMHRLWY